MSTERSRFSHSKPFLNNKQTNYKLSSHRAVYKRFNYNFAKWTESESESSKTAIVRWLIRIELVSLPVAACVSDDERATSSVFVYEVKFVCESFTSLRFAKETYSGSAHVSDGVENENFQQKRTADCWNASPKTRNALDAVCLQLCTRTASHKKLRI